MADFFGFDKKVVTEWILDPSGATTGIKKVAAEIRKQESLERNLTKVQQTLAKSTESLGQKLTSMAKGQALAFAKGQLLVGGLNMAKDLLIESARAAEQYGKVMRNFTGDLDGAKKAFDGQISALEIMTYKNKLDARNVKLSAAEYNKLAFDVKKVSTAMGMDLGEAMRKATDVMSKGSKEIATLLRSACK
jgi:hypothetical protein